MTERDRWPDVVIIHGGSVDAAGGWDEVVRHGPLLARFVADYGTPTEANGYLVLRRDGAVRDAGPAPEGCVGRSGTVSKVGGLPTVHHPD